MQTLLSRAILYLFALLSLKSIQTFFYPKIFDVFVRDWRKLLINIRKKIVALAANEAGRVRVKMSRKL